LLLLIISNVSSIEPELNPIEVLHRGNKEFGVFLRKIVEMCFLFVREYKCGWHRNTFSGLFSTILRWIVGRGHFR